MRFDRRTTTWLLITCAAVAVPATAVAGYRISTEVVIERYGDTITVAGVTAAAAESQDDSQFIACAIENLDETRELGTCVARTAAGRTVVCWTESPAKLAAIQSITPHSAIDIEILVDQSECNRIRVFNGSPFLP